MHLIIWSLDSRQKNDNGKKGNWKNGNGRNDNRKIGQREKSATKNKRVGKQGNTKLMYEITATEKTATEKLGNGKLGGNENWDDREKATQNYCLD